MAVTAEEKEQLLVLIRSGLDRGAAAQELGMTGTQFRRLCNPESPNYDPDFARAYAAACEERGPVSKEVKRPAATPRTTTEQGFTKAKYITREDWEEFLDRVRAGVPRDKAARDVGTSLSQMHTFASRSAARTTALNEAYTVGLPHFKEALRARAYELAMEGNYSALRDLAVVHLEEYAVLQTKRHEIGGIGGGGIEVWIKQALPNLPPELLDGLIRELENQVIDQEPRQLPPGSAEAA